jgi:hypothetical protein
MALRKPKKPKEGERLPDTPDMLAWKKEFEELDLDAHKAKLKALGLDDEELAEFEEMESGVDLEEEITHEGPSENYEKEHKSSKKKVTKKVKKK